MAKIESLPGIHWSPSAALMDVMEEAESIEKVLILYYRKGDVGHHVRAAGMTRADVLWLLKAEERELFDD